MPETEFDERPLRFLDKADVDDACRKRMQQLVRRAQALSDAKEPGKLESDFGKEHLAVIHDCNQFLRAYKRGDAAGRVEFRLDGDAKKALGDAGFVLMDPQGQVFKLFGWVAVDPVQGDAAALDAALDASFATATS